MNKPINIQPFICEVNKCPDIQRLKAEFTYWSSLANEANERASEYGAECILLKEENERLKAENDSLKSQLDLFKNAHKTEQDRRRNYEQALEKVRELGRKTGSIRLIEIADEVLK